MSERSIEFQGFDELIQWIDDFPRTVVPIVVKHMEIAAGIVEGVLKEYPPADAANAPGRTDENGRPVGYYERGRGWWYPVKQTKTLHGLRLKSEGVIKLTHKRQAALGAVGFKLSARSETLGRKWAHTVVKAPGEVVGLIGNSASYMPEVNGTAETQTDLMQARGWKNADQALDETAPEVDAQFSAILDEIKAEFGGS